MAKRIDVTGLTAFYGTHRAIEGISMHVQPKSVTAFIGPSGCGKSTFLRTLNRMHEVTPGGRVEGQVMLDNEDLYGPGVDPVQVRRNIGMVFQRFNLFPNMTVLENVTEAPTQVKGRPKVAAKDRAVELLQRVGLGHRMHAYPNQLSGG